MNNDVPLTLSNPEKLLYPEAGISKLDYVRTLIELSPYLLAHTSGRILTAIRYPHGVGGTFFYQKHLPQKAPAFVNIIEQENERFINLDNPDTLAWLGNLAVLEFHTPFCTADAGLLRALVFDLDPSEGQTFPDAAECALLVYDTLQSLGIPSLVKTSGASGLQIYIPTEPKTFDQGRRINEFFAKYFAAKYPEKITIERLVKNRGRKLYFDYLQMGPGKSIITAYSPRAVPCAAISMPVEWQELKAGLSPCDFTLKNAADRIKQKGDLFASALTGQRNEPLEEMIRQTVAV
jgi:bifunctional non-homologous end joining protein LigD